MLKSHRMRNNIDKRAGLTGDKLCICGSGIQDIDHCLFECPDASSERKVMFGNIEENVLKTAGLDPARIDAAFLLGDHPKLPKRLQPVVTAAVCGFLESTADRFSI